MIYKKTNSDNVSTPKVGVLNVTQEFNISQMNPKEVFHNTFHLKK